MKSDPVCVKVREFRKHYQVLDLIEVIARMYGRRLCPHTIPRVIADKTNKCEFKHPSDKWQCKALFYAQKPYTKYCPNCRDRYRAEILAISKNSQVRIGPTGKFAQVSSAWLYRRGS